MVARGDAGGGAGHRAAIRRGCWCSCLRHLGYAARFVSGYLIQLVADVKPLRGAGGADRRLHRPARLGGGVSARRRLGRARRHLGPDGGRGAYPARRQPRSAVGRADQRRWWRSARSTFDFAMSVRRVAETPRVTKPYTRRAVAGHPGRGRAGRSGAGRRRRAADDGRRADLRRRRRPRRARMEHRRRSARPSAAMPARCCGGS